MINRYTLTGSREEVSARFTAELNEHFKPRFNAAPSQLLPVLTSDAPKGFSWFYWGLSPERSRNKAISERILNRKAEDILGKPAYRKNFQKHRCLIPADGYYFWKSLGKKTMIPYRVVLSGRPLFGIAGLWEEFETETGEHHHTFSMITIVPSAIMSGQGERIPLILSTEQEKVWLQSNSEADLELILTTRTDYPMEQYSVSPAIEKDSSDLPSMILPTPPSDQFGNLTLFG